MEILEVLIGWSVMALSAKCDRFELLGCSLLLQKMVRDLDIWPLLGWLHND